MKKTGVLLSSLENHINNSEIINEKVSQSNVGWHIKHSLMAMNSIVDALQNSNPINYKWSFKIARVYVFTMGSIPRGRGKSPKIARPTNYDGESLRLDIEKSRIKIMELDSMDSGKFFRHPYFGDLRLNKAIIFLEIHTKHHLSIIADIVNGAKK